jgi:hypothetical protein
VSDRLPHEIITCIGPTGSGKTALLAKRLGPRHRRRITFDTVGECEDLYPLAHRAFGLERVYSALERWADAGLEDWHLVAILTREEIGELVWKLNPVYDGTTRGLAQMWGGVCLESFEVDVLMPVNDDGSSTRAAMFNAFARGRHSGLSLLCATQRPAQCGRMVTSQSQYIITFNMSEPGDLKWLERAGGRAFADAARRLGKYESAWLESATRRVYMHDASYRITRTIDPARELEPLELEDDDS